MDKDKQKEKSSSLKGLKLFFSGLGVVILWIALAFMIFFALKKFQIQLYQKPGEILYIGEGIIVSLLMAVLFVPLSLYYLICRRFFPGYWKMVTKNDYISTEKMGLIDKFCVGIAILSILVMLLSFNRYIALGKDYVVFSQAGFVQNRQLYSYNDISIKLEKDENTSNYNPRFYLKNKICSVGFFNADALVKNIQKRQFMLSQTMSYPTVEPRISSRKRYFAHVITLVLIAIGIGYFSRIFSKKRK